MDMDMVANGSVICNFCGLNYFLMARRIQCGETIFSQQFNFSHSFSDDREAVFHFPLKIKDAASCMLTFDL